ncbi:Filamentous growth regulator 27 [Candida viswanathii]|uniref:Filamentous growth regulator 27 n=1 Tax=Candida viswanathii TaxID=5486 RepID=A0A367Y181_9ASCO|nr:Filamentous growth regulator 27 [Candida viswanathii]
MDVDLEKRTKVSRACDYCKKRKFKCSGVAPCELCTKKGIECEFSIIDRRTIRRKNKKRTVRNKAATSGISKNGKDDDHIDKKTLKMLTKKSKIPLQFEPLLTFPLHKLDNNSINNKTSPESSSNGTSAPTTEANGNQEDQARAEQASEEAITRKIIMEEERDPPKVLYDSEGNLRYVGESSPLSFLFECRNIFLDRIGPSKFTSETDSLEVIDEPDESMEILQVALPSKQLSDEIVKIFYTNIQQACYFFEAEYFMANVVNPVYTNYSDCSPDKIALVNLVMALGLLFAEANNNPILKELQSPTMQSSAYFEFGFYLTKKHMSKGKLWITEAYSLAFCYYQAKQQRNTAWLMLGMAIRNAQALGLHRRFINESFKDHKYRLHRRRLFRSLYLLDRITSILLGRPLIIDDYDWDDFDCEDIYDIGEDGRPVKSFRFQCMLESCKISKLIGKVVRNFYLDGIINPYKAEKLAIELKLWSLNLPEELQIDKVFVRAPKLRGSVDVSDNKMPLMIMHLSQLYAIALLCRPFFMYLIFKKKKKRKNILKRPKTRPEIAMCNFCKATAKSSALIIQLVENYIASIQYLSARAELHGLTHTCFLAALIIGLSLLYLEENGYTIEDGYTPQKQMGYLNSSKRIFEYYSKSNPISLRFRNIIAQMQQSLMDKFNLDEEGNRTNEPGPKVEASKEPSPETEEVEQQQHHHHQQQEPPHPPQPQSLPITQQQQLSGVPGVFGDLDPDVPFHEDYDNFIDNFGNLLPMATMKQSMTNNIPYLMTTKQYQDNESPDLVRQQQTTTTTTMSSQHPNKNHYHYLPASDVSSTNPSSSLSYSGPVNRGEPLDAFMYSVGLNDILYDAK